MTLQNLFNEFKKREDMDGREFGKLAKDCKVIDKKCTSTDIDLIFAKHKTKGQRKINFDQFQHALADCATKKGLSVDDLVQKVLSIGGPKFTGTKAEDVSLADKSNFSGVAGRGGPSTVDGGKGLADLLDRTDADARGLKVSKNAAGSRGKDGAVPIKELAEVSLSTGLATPAAMRDLFEAFTNGIAEMDGRQFNKLAKDCKVINGKTCTVTDIDLTFAKHKSKGQRKITFTQFQAALADCATKRKINPDALYGAMLAAGGPKFTATKADSVALFDDKANYTGVHGKGGPSTVDKDKGLGNHLDRSDADVRGRKI